MFRNAFDGKLAATDYPKVNVCPFQVFFHVVTYISFSVLLHDVPFLRSISVPMGLALLQARTRASAHSGMSSPIIYIVGILILSKYYLSGLVGLVLIEMVANWGSFSLLLYSLLFIFLQPTIDTSTLMASQQLRPCF